MKSGIALIALVLLGCASNQPVRHQRPEVAVTHVVFFWLKTPGDQAAAEKLIAASDELGKLPGVVSVAAGRPLPSTRPVVDSSYDVGYMIRFTDEQALHAYESNPKHLKLVNELIVPLTAKRQVYDFRDGAQPAVKK